MENSQETRAKSHLLYRGKNEILERDPAYRLVICIAKLMDRWCLDPVVGFLLPGLGDVLSSVMALPFFYVSIFKIKSFPLTIAMLYNVMVDMLIGIIPWGLGDLLDIFNKSYKRNCRLIVGFVEDDKKVVRNVNRKAWWMGFLVVLLGFLIYVVAYLAYTLFVGGWELLAGCAS